MHTYIHTYIHSIQPSSHPSSHPSTHPSMHACIHAYTYTCTLMQYIYIYIHICTYVYIKTLPKRITHLGTLLARYLTTKLSAGSPAALGMQVLRESFEEDAAEPVLSQLPQPAPTQEGRVSTSLGLGFRGSGVSCYYFILVGSSIRDHKGP